MVPTEKILSKKAHVAIIGMGYVGLPLAMEFAEAGLRVTGLEVNSEKVSLLKQGRSYIQDVPAALLKRMLDKKRFSVTRSHRVLKDMDAIIICVPTPLRKTRDPDVSYIISSVKKIAKYLVRGQIIVLESTTYPGTTEELILPLLEETGFMVGRDFFLAFSPERVDPGNKKYSTRNIPKIIGGVTERCARMARLLYERAVDRVITVSSTRVAEMVKLLENTFRTVNIALVNEMALMCDTMEIDVWEVIDGAATKPFGFIPFYPGPGLGGHCLPIDPIYLSWKAKAMNFDPRFISLASEINGFMPRYVVGKITSALNLHKKCVHGADILIMGVSYKRDVSDTRESPALDIIRELLQRKARVSFTDPHVGRVDIEGKRLKSVRLTPQILRDTDAVVIVANHSCFDYALVLKDAPLVVDTRNATKGLSGKATLVKL